MQTRPFTACLLLVIATLAINMLSAYIRHSESGLGCEPWPDCYARVGHYIEAHGTADVAGKALTPTETAKQMHRAIATGLVILVLVVVYQARQRLTHAHGFATQIPYLIIFVILVLSVIGPASYLKTMPAIASVNLLGGIALCLLGWWLWLVLQHGHTIETSPGIRKLATGALVVAVVQICSGAWVSANFAAAACTELFGCSGGEVRTSTGWDTFWYFRELAVDGEGRIVIDRAQEIIHLTHKVLALLTAGVLSWLGIRCLSFAQARPWAIALLILLASQIVLGAGSVLLQLPLLLVLAHSLCATVLLACTVRIKLLLRRPTA